MARRLDDPARGRTALFPDQVLARLASAPGLAAFAHQQVEPGYSMLTLLLPP